MQPIEPELPTFEPGWVWLVGAGPGDPALLTLLALHALRTADVVVYDALVDPRTIALAPAATTRVYAGKRGGKPSPTQRDISRRLIELAREGNRVLRLKGGDPLLFGRGTEEALALVEANVPFRLVPGISAGLGGLAYAGIPLTHRETNSAVTFVTGHVAGGDAPSQLDWTAIARASPVIAVYMPLKHIRDITARLIGAGRAPSEPAAFVSKAATPEQHVVETTLAQAADVATIVSPPAIFVVGEVVRLRNGLDWLGALEGRTLDPDPLGARRPPKAVEGL
ncbi:MAG: uroporphyrinogen-III C-methyltransferase [Alphaproteobacteria bacterium]